MAGDGINDAPAGPGAALPLAVMHLLTLPVHSYILTNVVPSSSANEGSCEVFAFDEDRVARARKVLLQPEAAQDVAELFKMLAHPTRVQILRALTEQELCVCDLAQVLDLSVSATSYQLQMMRRAKLVRHRSEGKLAYYRVADEFVLALLRDGLGHLARGERAS